MSKQQPQPDLSHLYRQHIPSPSAKPQRSPIGGSWGDPTPPMPAPPVRYVPPKPHNGLAVAGLVLGIVGLFFSFFGVLGSWIAYPCGILGVIFGAVGWGHKKGKWALFLGIAAVVVATIFVIIFLTAVNHAVDDFNSCVNDTSTC